MCNNIVLECVVPFWTEHSDENIVYDHIILYITCSHSCHVIVLVVYAAGGNVGG